MKLSVPAALRALSEPTRLRILHLLRGGPLCVNDLVSALRILQPRASRHLARLLRAGLVVTERRGGFSFYGLAPARPGFHERLLALLDATPAAARDAAALGKLRKTGGCCPQHDRPRARAARSRRSP